MIPVIESVLYDVIDSKLKFIKNNIDIVDDMFIQSSTIMKNRLKEYITSGEISIIRGFPNDRAKIPCYSIILGSEREQQKSLGEVFDNEDSEYELGTEVEDLSVFIKNSKNVVQVTHKPIELITTVVDTNGESVSYNIINSNLGLIEILDDVEDVTISYLYKNSGNEIFSSLFIAQYRIETWTNNGDLTIMLYHLLKWMMLSSRDYMEEKGLSLQTIGGTDFEPSPEYFPELVYRRTLTFECLSENGYKKEFNFIQQISLNNEVT